MKKHLLLLWLISLNIAANAGSSREIIDAKEFVEKPKIFLIDVGQTLITLKTNKSIRSVLSWDTIGYFVKSLFTSRFKLKSHITDFYLDTLAKVSSPVESHYAVIGYNGKPMAPLQQSWMEGRISEKECIDIVNTWIESNQNEFANKSELVLFKKIFNFNFDTNNFINAWQYTEVINLLEKLYNERDTNGKRKNICIILSNQPTEIIPLMKINFPKIFQFSDAQVFSCFEGLVKPHPELFRLCLSLCPTKSYKVCFFIDDEQQNLDAAKTINIDDFRVLGIHPNQVNTELKKIGII